MCRFDQQWKFDGVVPSVQSPSLADVAHLLAVLQHRFFKQRIVRCCTPLLSRSNGCLVLSRTCDVVVIWHPRYADVEIIVVLSSLLQHEL